MIERRFSDEVVDAFRTRFRRPPEVVVRAPGRINLLGAHVDYNEGWVMPAAIDRAVWLAAASGTDRRLRLHALDLGKEADVDLDRLPPPVARRAGGDADWNDFPSGVAWALAEAGHRPTALDAVYASDVPIGAGVSSSAAVEVAFLLAWRELAGLDLDDAAVPRLGQRAENGYLGVGSGIMDQYASLNGAEGQVIFLDCRHLTHELLPFPDGAAVLMADSGVRRRLKGSTYNDRPRDCRQAVAILREHLPGTTALRDVSREDLEANGHRLPGDLHLLARHAVEECQRVRDGAAALKRGDLDAFGRLVRQSHESSRDLYQVSIPELDVLAAAAWGTPGCHGARMMGGGFGGCVAALVAQGAVDEVRAAMVAAFEREFGRSPATFPVGSRTARGCAPHPPTPSPTPLTPSRERGS